MANMKEQFILWMNANPRKNGDSYSKETINNYIKALESYSSKLEGIGAEYNNLFEFDTIDSFEKAKKIITSHRQFEQLNASYHRIFSSALQIYTTFLSTICSNNKKNNYDAFEKWMLSYDDHKYRDTTVKRYLIALDKAEERLDIQLSIDIWNIESIDEYATIFSEITDARQYEFVNKKYGNGDLSAALSAYKKFINYQYAIEHEWWPSKSEYDPGISKDTWLELLKNGTITDNAITMLKFMYAEGGEASCAQLSEKHGNTTAHYIMTAVQAAESVIKATGCPVMSRNEANSRFWTVLFVGKEDGSSNRFIWRMRDELYEAYEKYRGDPVTVKDTISAIKEYIASEGFTYSDGLIENFWLSLKSKPFVLLAGTSGTGKTRLVKLFAKAIGAECKLVAVRPNWSDSSDLFGHVDLNGRFVPGEITDYVKQAELNPNKPYFLCLDEMNLARVEYYLSDILSIIETRDKKNGKIISDVLIDRKHFGNDTAAAGKYGNIILPDNLYIVGTVNMDETTFPFSKKVLDRANTIEFSYVDLNSSFSEYGSDAEPMQLSNEFLKTEYLLLKECADEKKFVEDLCAYLQKINVILQKANAHVGYRVRDEIVFYMLNNKNSELLSKEAALDNEVMQKILPRIQGSSMAIKDMLCELFKDICAGDYTGLTGTLVYEQMRQYLESKTARLPKSAEKIMFMIRRFEEDGFTSYWL